MLRMRHSVRLTAGWLTAALLCAPAALGAQSVRVEDLGAGKLLVARETDRRFAETVILLVEYDERGGLGLTINRRTDVPISQALKNAADWSDPVYLGGPVETTAVFALLRSRDKQEGMKPVVDEVQWVTSKPVLEKMLAEGPPEGPEAASMHVYLGYSGWGAGQLDYEVKSGSWYIFDGSADLVFDPDLASLWSRLIARTEQRFAYQTVPAE
jgi:putative transcriptional regulator